MSSREKHDLIEFLAATGENYDRYLDWCEKRGVKAFTSKYLHTWIQRRRRVFQEARIRQKEEVRRMSMFGRERRIEELERDLELLRTQQVTTTHECTKCGVIHSPLGPDTLIKITEQKRKLSEAIAKERNEWLKPESNEGNELSARERLRSSFAQMLNEGKETIIMDGKIIVAKD